MKYDIKPFLRTFANELRRSVLSVKFFAMVIIAAGAYLMGCFEEIKVMWNFPRADVLYFFELMHNIGSFTSLSVLCCTVLNCTSFLRDRKSGYFRHMVIRSGERKYAAAKFLSCVITGGAILAFGEILFIMVLRIMGFPLMAENSSMGESVLMYWGVTGDVLRGGNIVEYFAVYALFAFLYGAIWSAVGIAVSAFFEDYYAASFSPYIISYAVSMFITGAITPDHILNGNFNLGGVAKSLLGAVLYSGALIAVIAVIFIERTKRRLSE